jgi:hypothetical protein
MWGLFIVCPQLGGHVPHDPIARWFLHMAQVLNRVLPRFDATLAMRGWGAEK